MRHGWSLLRPCHRICRPSDFLAGKDDQHPVRIEVQLDPPKGFVRRSDHPRGRKGDVADRPAQPVAAPADPVHRKQRHTRSGRKVKHDATRRGENHIVAAEDQAGPRPVADQGVQHCHGVIGTRARKAHGNDQRGLDAQKAFLEIRAVLFGYPVEPVPGNGRFRHRRYRIEVADHGPHIHSRRRSHIRATIGGYNLGRQRQRGRKILIRDPAPAKQRNW